MFKKQQVSTSKNWRAKRGCKTYPKATLISFPLHLKSETVSQSSADCCHLMPQSCTPYASALSSAVHNCPSLTANIFLIQPNLSSKYTPTCLLQLKIFCRSMLAVFPLLGRPGSLHVWLWYALPDVQTVSQALSLTLPLWHRLSLIARVARNESLGVRTRAEASLLHTCIYIALLASCALLYSL